MALKFNIDSSGMDEVKEAIANACSKAEHELAVQIEKDTAPFVPMRTGSLRERTRVIGNTIVYPGPYARYLCYGKLYVDPLTGSAYARKGVTKVPATPEKDLTYWRKGTRSHWFEASKAKNLKKWVRNAEKAVKDDL